MSNLIKVFTGSQITVQLLKSRLEEVGVSGVIKNDFQSGITAGFGGGTPLNVDFYIEEDHLPQAQEILDAFLKDNA